MGALCCSCLCPESSDRGVEMSNSNRIRILADAKLKGDNVKIKNGTSVEGSGIAVASVSIEQDATYFEVKVLRKGPVGIGVMVAGSKQSLQRGTVGGRSCPTSHGVVCIVEEDEKEEKKEEEKKTKEDEVTVDFEGGKFLKTRPNDIIGVAFCQSDMPMLSFYHNGTPISMYDVDKVRGTVRPAISVEQGSSAEFIFDEESFKHSPPNSRCCELIAATSVL